MSSFNYIGVNAPTQDEQSNKGIFNIEDNYNLIVNGDFVLGSMYKHITTMDITSQVATLDFVNPELVNYGQLLIVANNLKYSGSTYSKLRLTPDGGTTYRSSGYSNGGYYGRANGGLTNDRNGSRDGIHMSITGNTATTGYHFVLLLGGLSTEYNTRAQFYQTDDYTGQLAVDWGGGFYNTDERHNGFQFVNSGSYNFSTGTVSVYGLEVGF